MTNLAIKSQSPKLSIAFAALEKATAPKPKFCVASAIFTAAGVAVEFYDENADEWVPQYAAIPTHELIEFISDGYRIGDFSQEPLQLGIDINAHTFIEEHTTEIVSDYLNSGKELSI